MPPREALAPADGIVIDNGGDAAAFPSAAIITNSNSTASMDATRDMTPITFSEEPSAPTEPDGSFLPPMPPMIFEDAQAQFNAQAMYPVHQSNNFAALALFQQSAMYQAAAFAAYFSANVMFAQPNVAWQAPLIAPTPEQQGALGGPFGVSETVLEPRPQSRHSGRFSPDAIEYTPMATAAAATDSSAPGETTAAPEAAAAEAPRLSAKVASMSAASEGASTKHRMSPGDEAAFLIAELGQSDGGALLATGADAAWWRRASDVLEHLYQNGQAPRARALLETAAPGLMLGAAPAVTRAPSGWAVSVVHDVVEILDKWDFARDITTPGGAPMTRADRAVAAALAPTAFPGNERLLALEARLAEAYKLREGVRVFSSALPSAEECSLITAALSRALGGRTTPDVLRALAPDAKKCARAAAMPDDAWLALDFLRGAHSSASAGTLPSPAMSPTSVETTVLPALARVAAAARKAAGHLLDVSADGGGGSSGPFTAEGGVQRAVSAASSSARCLALVGAFAQEASRAWAVALLLAPESAAARTTSSDFSTISSRGRAATLKLVAALEHINSAPPTAVNLRHRFVVARAAVQASAFDEALIIAGALTNLAKALRASTPDKFTIQTAVANALADPPPQLSLPRVARAALDAAVAGAGDNAFPSVMLEFARFVDVAGGKPSAERWDAALQSVRSTSGVSAAGKSKARSARSAAADHKVWSAAVSAAMRMGNVARAREIAKAALAAAPTGRAWALVSLTEESAAPALAMGSGDGPVVSAAIDALRAETPSAWHVALDAAPFSGQGATRSGELVREGLSALPRAGELWCAAARLLTTFILSGDGRAHGDVNAPRELRKRAFAYTPQDGDAIVGAALAKDAPLSTIARSALSATPMYGRLWAAHTAWPMWASLDRSDDVVTRAAATVPRATVESARIIDRIDALYGGDGL